MTNPTLPITRKHSLDDFCDAIRAGLALLREGGDIPADEIPGDAEAERWTREVWTDRGGDLRQRRSTPKGASREARCLKAVSRWLAGNGTLDGLVMAQFGNRDCFAKCETLALVMRIVGGATTSPAVEAWKRTGLVDA